MPVAWRICFDLSMVGLQCELLKCEIKFSETNRSDIGVKLSLRPVEYGESFKARHENGSG